LSLQLGDLRAALTQLGLSAAGKRPVLAARLAAALRSAAAAADSDADGDEMDPGA
jgi:hypothetical protein